MNSRRIAALRGRCTPALLVLLLIATGFPGVVQAAGQGEPGPYFPVRIELTDRPADLQRLQRMGIDIDGVFDGWARAYVVAEEREKLVRIGFRLEPLPDEGKIGLARLADEGVALGHGRSVPAQYHTYATLTADLQTIAAEHPSITRLYDIGSSVQGRSMWMMKITRNPDIEEDEPEVAYISSMHGDEVTGKELCFNLINYLTDNYGTDPRVTDLVDRTEIWVMPSMNPDGTELGQRYNAQGVDLNRDFPDQFTDPVNTTAGRAPETAVVMNWTATHSTDLSANFHGGALLVNYPFDGNPAGTNTFSPAPDPDHPAFYSVSRTYADTNPPMYANDGPAYLTHGVTNGADWYVARGAMQDWRYVWHGGFEVTIEVSNTKWPPASQLPQFWEENQESMLAYFERVHEGLRGIVTGADDGRPLAAEIRLDADPLPSYTDPDLGDYHRLVLPGSYTVSISAPGYVTRVFDSFVVAGGDATRLDASLERVPGNLQPELSRVEDGAGGNGLIDPGETTDLAVTLKNLGRSVTGVDAELKPISWYVDVTRPLADYPDIGMNASAESLPPHHEVSLSPATPQGHKAGFYLTWNSDDGGGTTEPFLLDVGEPDCQSVAAADLPQTVTRIFSASSQVEMGQRQVDSMRVSVEVLHTYIGDLRMTLSAPSGTSVVLHDQSGGSSDNIVGTYPISLTPDQPLTAFTAEQAAGTWTLDIVDSELTNNGSLESWSLEICGYPPEPTPRMRFRELNVVDGDAHLRWWEYPGLWSYRVYRSTDPSSAAGFIDVTAEDPVDTDTRFVDSSAAPLTYFLVTGVGPQGEGPKGHFGE